MRKESVVVFSAVLLSLISLISVSAGSWQDYYSSDKITGFAIGKISSASCTETDGGDKSEVAGVTTIKLRIKGLFGMSTQTKRVTDNCANANTLREFYCPSATSKTPGTKIYACANGCASGACKNKITFTKNGTIIFTYQGESMPNEIITTLCDPSPNNWNSFNIVPLWYERESQKYGIAFNLNLECIKNPIKLPVSFLTTENDSLNFLVDGTNMRQPIKDYEGILSYLKNINPALNNKDVIVIVHYIPNETQFFNFAFDKSFFLFIKSPSPNDPSFYYPALDSPTYSSTFAHEFAHILGASDKYGVTYQQACLINPLTNKEFNGYDLMCHRIPFGSGYRSPPLPELIISDPTAKEIGWIN